jgi:glycosyltransferase involved in cell wall biosynthesis
MWRLRQLRLAAPTLLLDMDDWEQAWAPINRYPKITALFLAWQEEWGIRHADGLTTASRWLHRRAQEYAPTTPALYLPNGIADALLGESALPRRKETNSQKSVLFFTRYIEVTPIWLADFAAHLLNQDPQIRFVIAGEPLQPKVIETLQSYFAIRNLHDPQQVEWLGAVAKDELPALLDRSVCAIFPAQPTTLQLAKCSVRLATTLLHGVPVVASAVGEQAQYGAEGAALLVPAEATPVEFSQAVLDLLADDDAQERMIAAARRRLAEHYSWRRLGEQLEAFYGGLSQFAA